MSFPENGSKQKSSYRLFPGGPGDQQNRDHMRQVHLLRYWKTDALRPAVELGRIVNVSSQAARSGGQVAGSHYAAAKAGVIGLTKSLAGEIGKYGITVSAVTPGRTRLFPRSCAEKVAPAGQSGRKGRGTMRRAPASSHEGCVKRL